MSIVTTEDRQVFSSSLLILTFYLKKGFNNAHKFLISEYANYSLELLEAIGRGLKRVNEN